MRKDIIKPIIGITLLTTLIGMFLIGFFKHKSEDEIIRKYGVSGFAIVTKTTNNLSGKRQVYYEYIVRDSLYKGSCIYYTSRGEVIIGGKYKLLYYPKNPNIERILLDQPVE